MTTEQPTGNALHRTLTMLGALSVVIGLALLATSLTSDAKTSDAKTSDATTSVTKPSVKAATSAKSTTTKKPTTKKPTAKKATTKKATTTVRKTAATTKPVNTAATLAVSPQKAAAAKADYRFVRPGAEGDNDLRKATTALPAPLRTLSAGGSAAEIQAKINQLQPGDELRIASGTYEGQLTITVSGTQLKPIVIRSDAPQSAVFVGQTSIVVTGSDVAVADFRFLKTGTAPIHLDGLRTKVVNNVFEQCGDTTSGAATGLLLARNPSPGWPPANALYTITSAPLVVRNNVIAGNTFLQSRNTILWQDHGIVGNEFSFNTIDGPHGMDANFETEAIKIGYSFGTDETRTRIIFNTIRNWSGIPYVIGIKSNRTLVGYNLLSGRVQLRYGNNNAVIGNVITDGDLHVGGSGHLIKFNVVRTLNPRDNYGPFAPFFTSTIVNQYGTFDGTDGRPNYIDRFENSRVEDNAFVSATASDGAVIQATGYADVRANEPPRGNLFARNLLVRTVNWNNFLAVSLSTPVDVSTLFTQNRWQGNVLHCTDQCTDAQITLRLPAGNRVGDAPNGFQARAAEYLVPFSDALIDGSFAFMSATLPPVSGFAATP